MNRDTLSKWFAFCASIVVVLILLAEYAGALDYMLNISLLEGVSERFELSYGPDPSKPIRPSDVSHRSPAHALPHEVLIPAGVRLPKYNACAGVVFSLRSYAPQPIGENEFFS
jgi:hypothetical protein